MDDELVLLSREACYAALETAFARDEDPEKSELVEIALNITMLAGQGMQLQSIIEQIEGRGIAADGFRKILGELEVALGERIGAALRMVEAPQSDVLRARAH